jgi:N-hydroxyarylamine O-acetyltransferase
MPLDLTAYLSRIHYHGPRTPTLDTLRAIILQHTQHLPFENFDPLLRRAVRLDLPSLEHKLIASSRGGYCFEHNTLLFHALEALGFSVSRLSARVRWNQPPEAETARSHALLRVELAGASYLVDVGFGGLTLTGVLALKPDVDQDTPHGPFRLHTSASGALELRALVGADWIALYRFTLEPQFHVDYEVSNHYTSTHPSSHFLERLLMARSLPGQRLALQNNLFSIHTPGQPSQRRTLTSPAELRSVIEQDFELRLPDDPALPALLARLAG